MTTREGGRTASPAKRAHPVGAMTKVPKAIDVSIGQRIRARRIELNMSQEKLGEKLGLTFQQIQKYEKGTNRVGGSRMSEIAKALTVPVSYLFGEHAQAAMERPGDEATAQALFGNRLHRRAVAAYLKLPEDLQKAVVSMLEAAAERTN